MKDITIHDKIICVEREVALRERFYPKWVKEGKMTQGKADWELAVMESVLQLLQVMAMEYARVHAKMQEEPTEGHK